MIVYRKRWFQLLQFAFFAIGIFVGVEVIFYTLNQYQTTGMAKNIYGHGGLGFVLMIVVVFCAVIVVSAVMLLLVAYDAYGSAPNLIVDEQGVFVKGRVLTSRIPWRDIKDVKLVVEEIDGLWRRRIVKKIVFSIDQPEKYMRKLLWHRLEPMFSTAGTSMTHEEVLDCINQNRAKYTPGTMQHEEIRGHNT